MAYSSGCIFVLDASDVLKCIDVTTRTASTVTVPAGKPLPTGQVWLTGSLIDFPDGRFGKVSAPTGSGSSYSSTLRLYTVSGTGSAVTLAWSEDITLLDIESFPSDDHGIATDGTYLYRIQYASGYKVWRLRSGVDSSIIFNGNGSGSCAGSGTLCSINEPGTTNATYIAHDHAGNRYFVGDYSHPQFYMTEAQSPGSGPGSDSTPPSQPGAPDLVDGSDAGSSNTDNVTSVGSPNISVVAAENGGTLTVTATKTGSSDVTCTMVGTTSGATCQLTSLADGTWSISASHADGAGNVSSTSSALSITIDTTAPVATLASVTATSTSTNIAFTVTGNENITCASLSSVVGDDFDVTNVS
ncbi:MAG: Ig-like domain-containing protein, partial [Ilumatobacteraceae bacterium]